jgi:hypothetical protein
MKKTASARLRGGGFADIPVSVYILYQKFFQDARPVSAILVSNSF